MFGIEQFRAKPLLLVMLAVGVVLFKVVVTLAELVQPPMLTTTLNVPADETTNVEVVSPFPHKYVPPPVAVKVVLGVVQFKAKPLLLVMAAVGV